VKEVEIILGIIEHVKGKKDFLKNVKIIFRTRKREKEILFSFM